ncbi:serine/threonine protein kinase [Catenulispora sp. GP43]
MEALAPQMIGGRYRLDRELAAGGFGAVWQAYDSVLRVEVAIKQVRIDPYATGADRAKAVARAEHEARNADCTIDSRSAARPKCSSSATARKYLSWRSSTVP